MRMRMRVRVSVENKKRFFVAINQRFGLRVTSAGKRENKLLYTPAHKCLTRKQRVNRRVTVFVRQIRTYNTRTSLAETHSQQACDLLNGSLQQVHLVLTWKQNRNRNDVLNITVSRGLLIALEKRGSN